jgi:hypothetical protein
MSNPPDATTRTNPSAVPPTEAELAAWNALSRDEQVARYRAYFADPACQTITDVSMADIREAARRRLAERG